MGKITRYLGLCLIITVCMLMAACGRRNSVTVGNNYDENSVTETRPFGDTVSGDTGDDKADSTDSESKSSPAVSTEDSADGNTVSDSVTEEILPELTDDATKPDNSESQTTEASRTDAASKPTNSKPAETTAAKPATAATKPATPAQSATAATKPATPTQPTTATAKPTTPTQQATAAAKPTSPVQPTTTAAPTVTVPAGGDFSKTAIEVAKAMGDGINLGNTMEATAGNSPWFDTSKPTNWETAWGQPITTQAMITGMKNAGFESIRIPVAWSNMMATDGTYKIADSFFKRVDEIIGYAYANNMYVIINIHYDGGWWDSFATDETGTMKRYKAMWTQIAMHYKDYDDKLIFESANEELGDKLGYDRVNRINQAFVDVVRGTGGNNVVRYLLIAGYNTDIDKTCSASFKMPTDICSNHLLISVHYYTPWTYCGMWNDESWGKAVYSWGTAANKTEMENYFKKMKRFTDAGYGVIIGEYSALPNYNNGTYTKKDGAVEFLSYVRQLSAKYGYAAYLWDTGDWYNKSACSMRWQDTNSLYK